MARPQAPHSPQSPGSTLPGGVLGERDSELTVTNTGTIVERRLISETITNSPYAGLTLATMLTIGKLAPDNASGRESK